MRTECRARCNPGYEQKKCIASSPAAEDSAGIVTYCGRFPAASKDRVMRLSVLLMLKPAGHEYRRTHISRVKVKPECAGGEVRGRGGLGKITGLTPPNSRR